MIEEVVVIMIVLSVDLLEEVDYVVRLDDAPTTPELKNISKVHVPLLLVICFFDDV